MVVIVLGRGDEEDSGVLRAFPGARVKRFATEFYWRRGCGRSGVEEARRRRGGGEEEARRRRGGRVEEGRR
jgi:hypothetical protein